MHLSVQALERRNISFLCICGEVRGMVPKEKTKKYKKIKVFNEKEKMAFDICNEKKKSVGIFCDSAAQAEKYRKMGANFLWVCTDDQIVKAGLNALIAPLV